jgi:anti-sigma factor RsiW
MHDPWTDKLSEYLDGELETSEQQAIEAHVATCADCARTLEELRRVIAQGQSLTPRPPERDLWQAVAGRIRAGAPEGAVRSTTLTTFVPRQARRFSFTVPQLAAASILIAMVSGGIVWRVRTSPRAARGVVEQATSPPAGGEVAREQPVAAPATAPELAPISLADAQYDAAVADLQRALDKGRGKLDAATIAIVEQNLKIIDRAIAQAREALAADPANAYLNGHLIETRRKKLDLMRRAAALTTETD